MCLFCGFVQAEDGQSIRDPTDEGLQEGEDYFQGMEDDCRGPHEFVWLERTTIDIDAAVQDAFTRADHLHDEMQQRQGCEEEHMEAEEDCEMFGKEYEELI